MTRADSTQIRIVKSTNERMKPFADVLDYSVSDFTDKALLAMMDILDGAKEPLLVAEYRLKKSYQKAEKKK